MEDDSQSFADPAAKALEQRRAAMLELLSNRHNSRNTTTSVAPPEQSQSTQSFLSNFSKFKLPIESHLSQLRQNPNSDPSHKQPQLESISLQISSLEKLVAENSYFLPPYEVRSCLSSVDVLRRSLDEVTSLVIPQKKFSFKNKTKTTTVIPAVAREVDRKPNAGPERIGFGFRDRENEVLVNEFSRSELEGQSGEFTLSGLRNCEVRLKGCVRALFVDKLMNCKVYVGAVTGSVLIEGAEECVFVLASHQIRIHEAKKCDFYLKVRSRPIIEDCSGVRFAPYCLSYQGIEGDMEEAKLAEETGNWANVDDFQWLRAVQSPNWSVLPEGERINAVDIS